MTSQSYMANYCAIQPQVIFVFNNVICFFRLLSSKAQSLTSRIRQYAIARGRRTHLDMTSHDEVMRRHIRGQCRCFLPDRLGQLHPNSLASQRQRQAPQNYVSGVFFPRQMASVTPLSCLTSQRWHHVSYNSQSSEIWCHLQRHSP